YDFSIDFISISPYVHGEWQATERLRLIAGLRFDYAKYDYETALPADLSPDASHKRPPDQKVSFDDVSPKVGLVFDISERLNAYASYRRGFRIPTSSQLFRPFRNENSTMLNPVKADNFEIGLRGQPADWIDFEITAFHLTNKDDILVFTDNETGIRQVENSGKTRHQGIELGLNIQASPEWRISTNWTFSKHAFVRWRPVPGINLSGNEINRAPERFGNTRVRYSPSWLEGGFIEAEWQHFGPYFLDDDNTRTYEGHDLFNLRIEVPVKQVRVFARLHNITDKRYATNGRFNRFAGEELKPGLPFTVFGGVSAGF
ncbi:MAG: TonB-dependent receptor, partial [Alphaproteobacteria bacterium]|nr:TonB-dependent receptor [Alphaproteobacteria bacterium]